MSQFFSYHEENLDNWAQGTLKEIFHNNQSSSEVLAGDADTDPTVLNFQQLNVKGSCWRAQKSATKVVHFFELGFVADWSVEKPPTQTDSAQEDSTKKPILFGSVYVPSVCLDDADDADFEIRVRIGESATGAVAPKVTDDSNSAPAVQKPTPAVAAAVKLRVKSAVYHNLKTFSSRLRSYVPGGNFDALHAKNPDSSSVDVASLPAAANYTADPCSSDDDDAPTLNANFQGQHRKATSSNVARSKPRGPKTAVELAAESIARAKEASVTSEDTSLRQDTKQQSVDTEKTMFVRVRVDQEDIDDAGNARKNAPADLKNEYELEVSLGDTVSHVISMVRASLVQQCFSDEYVERAQYGIFMQVLCLHRHWTHNGTCDVLAK